jgi:uncharacterized protein YqfB (UPF0267 family)
LNGLTGNKEKLQLHLLKKLIGIYPKNTELFVS